MDDKLLVQLRKKHAEVEELERVLIAELEIEKNKIVELKSELKTRGKSRDSTILQLLELGFRPVDVARYAGVVPSYINYVLKRDSE